MENNLIISTNASPTPEQFQSLMSRLDYALNQDASVRESYYQKRSGKKLEEDVYDMLVKCAKDTEFEGSITLVSGKDFPDIVAHRYYGVEVKSTEGNKWQSIGSSILESTRIQDVQRIYLTFGKLGSPVEFISRPYDECMVDIAVTHYPRYKIDMRLGVGETIFDKMGIPYDTLRNLDNPVEPVSAYYKRHLKPGQRLWWASENLEQISSPILQIWSTLDKQKKDEYTVLGFVLFPEIVLGNSQVKYQNFALWLVTNHSIVNTSVRDLFSAGGQPNLVIDGITAPIPASVGRVHDFRCQIIKAINELSIVELKDYWCVPEIEKDRVAQWSRLVASYVNNKIKRDFWQQAILRIIKDEGCSVYRKK